MLTLYRFFTGVDSEWRNRRRFSPLINTLMKDGIAWFVTYVNVYLPFSLCFGVSDIHTPFAQCPR